MTSFFLANNTFIIHAIDSPGIQGIGYTIYDLGNKIEFTKIYSRI